MIRNLLLPTVLMFGIQLFAQTTPCIVPPGGTGSPIYKNNISTCLAENGIVYAAAPNFSGSDACAKINAAITSLPSTPGGGVIDARGFLPSGSPASIACTTSILVNKSVTILFAPGLWIFSPTPNPACTSGCTAAINISAQDVILKCPGSSILQQPSFTTLESGTATPLIANYTDPKIAPSEHTTDGLQVLDCALNGNSIGTFGIFAPATYSNKFHGLHVSNFTSAGILAIGGQNDVYNTVVDGSGLPGPPFQAGDGFVLGYDGHVSGMSQSNGNQGDGWHFVSGGYVLDGATAYRNGLHGLHLDGNLGQDWFSSGQYVEQKIIIPTNATNNPNHYAFYTQKIGNSSGSYPTWCQTLGCNVTDPGGVVWINVGAMLAYGNGNTVPEVFTQGLTNINSPNMSESGSANRAGDWDNVRIEGTPAIPNTACLNSCPALQNSVIGAKVRQSETINPASAHGIHVILAATTSVKDTQWIGGAYTPPNPPSVDLGGMEIDNSTYTEISFLFCLRSYGSCLTISGSSDSTITKLVANNGGANFNNNNVISYALTIADAGSTNNIINEMLVVDDRSSPYRLQAGVSNAAPASALVIKDQQYVSLAQGDIGNPYQQEALGSGGPLGPPGSFFLNSLNGYQWNVSAFTALTLTSSGLNSINGFLANGQAGITAVKTAGSCVITVTKGIITGITGC